VFELLHHRGLPRQSPKQLHLLAIVTSMVAYSAATRAQSQSALQTAPVQLEFTAPAECPTQMQFTKRVRQRSDRIEFQPVSKKQLTIAIQGKTSDWKGRATFTDSDQEPLSRAISARSCDEVVDGLALVTVLVLDPDAIQGAGNEQPSTLATRPALVAPPSKPLSIATPTRVTSPEGNNAVSHLGFGVSAVAGAKAGPAPGVMWSGGASAHLNLERQSP